MTDPLNPQSKAFLWSGKRYDAALLLAEDNLSDTQIARRCQVSERTLHLWKRQPEFVAQIHLYIDELQQYVKYQAFGRLDKRNALRERRLDEIDRLIRERAEEMTGEVAGGGTGHLLRIPRSVSRVYERDPEDPESKTYREQRHEFEYRTDTQLLKEERQILRDYALDSGQFSKTETTSIDVTVTVTVEQRKIAERIAASYGLDVDELLAEANDVIGIGAE